ncbi:MAG: PGPGW domain-containing protein [Candidatus Solibacter usitatus]|nr:PGPGW domain-containing protein [Candidatus Solibacter usitatus]
MTKFLKILSGIGLVILGIIGLILPIMPGWVFLIPGLVILSEYFHPIKRLLRWARDKFENDKSTLSGPQ